MIIECKNCSKKFIVNEDDIPSAGRTVQCGNCSTQWLQMPLVSSVAKGKSETESSPPMEEGAPSSSDIQKASDGNNYKFLGGQWGLVLPSGKIGKLAKKNISSELNKLTGRPVSKKVHKKPKKNLDSDIIEFSTPKRKESMGIFSFLIVLIMFIVAVILFLDTFKNQIIPFWPELGNYLTYIFETSNNIYIITKDLFNNYK